ncbi:hypothetical protein [Clostridium sp. 001]|uniref:hypothetical protein n=1 Tax=Clostridium sp. 001 TaxID=1970093 RepID=UPI001C2C90FD|nr:hypothetical protein [Clostridium sp. 001]QXE19768.1 hypothetical protein B5S50_13560 [Clostridium sp. 001]
MNNSGILQQVVKIEKVNKESATHFALCNGDEIRYLIALQGGKQRLSQNIATYSNKLSLLMKMLNYLSFSVLKVVGLGYYVKAILHSEIEKQYQQTVSDDWNMIIGTYGGKQKLVLQCFVRTKKMAVFIKIGNDATESEMRAEIAFLSEKHSFTSFAVPKILDSKLRDEQFPFNIQVTKEFVGDKVEPELTEDIVRIYHEIAGTPQTIGGQEYEFSHGDFAPWNIKKKEDGYVVFDWEHCGMRMKGFDLMHYVVVSDVMLNGASLSDAYDRAIGMIRKFLPEFNMDRSLFLKEYGRLRLG